MKIIANTNQYPVAFSNFDEVMKNVNEVQVIDVFFDQLGLIHQYFFTNGTTETSFN